MGKGKDIAERVVGCDNFNNLIIVVNRECGEMMVSGKRKAIGMCVHDDVNMDDWMVIRGNLNN